MKRPLRVYADTSVFGGCLEEKFEPASRRFFDQVRAGEFLLVVSDVTLDELELAPEKVRTIVTTIDGSSIERIWTSAESESLAREYLEAGVLGAACLNDARHIAVATIGRGYYRQLEFQAHREFSEDHGLRGNQLDQGVPKSTHLFTERAGGDMSEEQFDCVQMKWEIQQQLLEEEARLGKEEARRQREERLRKDPVLGPFLQRLEEERRPKAG